MAPGERSSMRSAKGLVARVLGHNVRASVRAVQGFPLLALSLALRKQFPVLLGHVVYQGTAVGRAENGPESACCPHEPLRGVALTH